MTVSAVFFDLDGTLVDSLQDLADAVNHMLRSLDKQVITLPEVRHLVGKGARNLVQRALKTDSSEQIERGLRLFTAFNEQHIADSSRLYPGVPELLQQLVSNNLRMTVISNKNEALSRLILKVLEIEGIFERIAGGDTFPELKPSPLPLLEMTRKLGLKPENVIMVGDSINDIQAGNSAGITTIGCTWGYGGLEEIGDAQYRASSPAELCSLIATITGR
jgi:phosphoglycolate phosphatase